MYCCEVVLVATGAAGAGAAVVVLLVLDDGEDESNPATDSDALLPSLIPFLTATCSGESGWVRRRASAISLADSPLPSRKDTRRLIGEPITRGLVRKVTAVCTCASLIGDAVVPVAAGVAAGATAGVDVAAVVDMVMKG